MQILTVKLPQHNYPIYIGENILASLDLLTPHLPAKQVLIVSQQPIADLYLNQIVRNLTGYQIDILLLPQGEEHKTLVNVEKIITKLLENNHRRNTCLIALGGGVIGDITGFAASCYQRGISYIHIPTTLLAQVDSSIGGKTAVNHTLAKNMIGAFHQPQAVIIDIATLNSLNEREYNSGIAEIIKAALICDAAFFNWLETNSQRLLSKDSSILIECITRACTIKRDIITVDEKEIHGTRALLNLGHSFGHALEQITNYTTYLHGEAVAIGLGLAAKFSQQFGGLLQEECSRVEKLLQSVNLPSKLPTTINLEKFLDIMQRDKKNSAQDLSLILLTSIGKATTQKITIAKIRDFLIHL